VLLETIPGVGDLLGPTPASEIGDVARFATARKPIGYAGLAPRVHQSGERSHTGALSKPGSRTLRWAAVEAAHAARRPTNPWHELNSDIAKRTGKNPAKSALAPKILIARWHIPGRQQPSKPAPPQTSGGHRSLGKLPLPSGRPTAPHGIEKPSQLPPTIRAPSAKREMSHPLHHAESTQQRPPPARQPALHQRESDRGLVRSRV
jgi:Transposase IS116/IS110/IS902 family